MIQRARLPWQEDERLQAMVQAIVEGVQPSRVILFGSRARGDARPDSDYDLVVELAADLSDWSGYTEASARVNRALSPAKGAASVDVLLRKPGDIERRRDDPGYMDWDIARHGVVLYPAGVDSLTLRPIHAPADRVREHGPYESIKDWLERIEQDLRVIELNLNAGESAAWGAAGFHAQQAAEKFLKLLLVQAGVHPERTHKMEKLVADVRATGYDFPTFGAECKLLNPYAVAIRYPEQLTIPNEDGGREVIAAAKRIIQAAKALITA
jgi:HEPN domain-containing protein/predicted nucleotidyltransferase